MKSKTILILIGLISAVIGIYFIFHWFDYKLFVIFILMMFSNNISMKKQ